MLLPLAMATCVATGCGGNGARAHGGVGGGGDTSVDLSTANGGDVDSGAANDGHLGTGGGDGGAGADGGGGNLNPSVAPGGNFALQLWELQEPIGSPGSPKTISPAQLVGAAGFHDAYFFTDATDGAMTFWDPESGVTTANSSYPRSELREMTATGAPADWPMAGTHRLSATLRVTMVPDHVCVGQIHLGSGTPTSTKPLLELFYHADGSIVLGLEQSPAGGNELQHAVGHVALGTRWRYTIELAGNTLTLVIDGGAAQTFAVSNSFNGYNMYFKAGDYDQSVGSNAAIGAKVAFYALTLLHGP